MHFGNYTVKWIRIGGSSLSLIEYLIKEMFFIFFFVAFLNVFFSPFLYSPCLNKTLKCSLLTQSVACVGLGCHRVTGFFFVLGVVTSEYDQL